MKKPWSKAEIAEARWKCGRRFFRSRSFNQRESCLGQDEKFGRSPIVDFQIAATVLMHEVKTQDKQWRDKRVKYGLLPGGSETTTAALLHSRKRTPA